MNHSELLNKSAINGTNNFMIYTDGGCHNNDDRNHKKGTGSYAWLHPTDLSSGSVTVYCRFIRESTNNRTEMLAIINGIRHINENVSTVMPSVHVISDSGYVVDGYTNPSYLDKWSKNNWVTSNNKPVSNQDLWHEMISLSYRNAITFEHIRGHKQDKNHLHAFWNDICDNACTYIMNNFTDEDILYELQYNFKERKISYANL